jgi:hypothetical protein
MPILPQVNRWRAWLLFSMIWLSGAFAWYQGSVRTSWTESASAKREVDTREREHLFNVCLEKHGQTLASLEAVHKARCTAAPDPQCEGLWCAHDPWRDWCIRSSAPGPCVNIGTTLSGDGSALLHERLPYEMDQSLKRAAFFWQSGFSETFKEALIVSLVPPFLFLLGPPLWRRTWKWLTASQPRKAKE